MNKMIVVALLLALIGQQVYTQECSVNAVVQSAGFEDGNYFRVIVNQSDIEFPQGRGVNIVLFNDGVKGEEVVFDTWGNSAAAIPALINFINGLEDGQVVVAGCMDECANNQTNESYAALQAIGWDASQTLQFRDAFAIIGQKGAAPGSVPQAIGRKNSPGTAQVEGCLFAAQEQQQEEAECSVNAVVSSAGFEDGNYFRVVVNQSDIEFPQGRGVNIVLFNDGVKGEQVVFDTWGNSAAAIPALINFINGLEDGQVVVAGCMDECANNQTNESYAALQAIGWDASQTLQFRDAFAIIGQKGAAPGSVPQAIGRKNSPGTAQVEGCLFSAVEEQQEEEEVGCTVNAVVSSAGFEDGNYFRVVVNQSDIEFPQGRGVNIVLFNEGVKGEQVVFDTWGNSASAIPALINFINGLEDGQVVVAGCMDECANNQTNESYAALQTIGWDASQTLQFRDAFAIIGQKGAAPGSVPQAIGRKNSPGTAQVEGCLYGGSDNADQDCVTLYSECDYMGEELVVCEDNPVISFTIKSVYVPEGVQAHVFNDQYYEGEKAVFSESIYCIEGNVEFQFVQLPVQGVKISQKQQVKQHLRRNSRN